MALLGSLSKGSLRKQTFLFAHRRWGTFHFPFFLAKRPSAAMSEEKRLFSQATFAHKSRGEWMIRHEYTCFFRVVTTNTSHSIFFCFSFIVLSKINLTSYMYTKLQMSSHIFTFSEWSVFVLSMLETFDSSRPRQDCNCFFVVSATKSPPVAKWRKWFTKFVKVKWPSSFPWKSCDASWSLNLLQSIRQKESKFRCWPLLCKRR